MLKLKDRIALAIAHKGVDIQQADLMRLCKISRASVSNWYSGTTKTLSGETALILSDFFGCDQAWLARGQGAPNWRNAADDAAAQPNTASERRAVYISRPEPLGLGATLAHLGGLLRDTDPVARKPIGQLLAQLADDPSQAEQIAGYIESLLSKRTKRA